MNNQEKRFVIHKHSTDGDTHWDLMLETENALQTFRLNLSPQQILQTPALAEKIHDHPLKFLTYQGPVQNGKASVKIVDSGTYNIVHQTNEKIELNLTGQILNGKFTLIRIHKVKWLFNLSEE
jgi:hypothetical protein